MKILLLTHEFSPYPGGVARYCSNIADAATSLGHELTVHAPNHKHFDTPSPPYDLVKFDGDIFNLRHLNQYRKTIREYLSQQEGKFDVIHAADWPAILALGGIPTSSRTIRIATLHGTDILVFKHSIRARLLGAHRSVKSFQALVCNSKYTQSILAQYSPTLINRSRVIPLGVDRWWFRRSGDEASTKLRQKYGIPEHNDVVLTVARLDTRKGQGRTIEALGALPQETRRRVTYLCVGQEVSEGYGDHLKRLATKHDVQLVLTGRIKDEELSAAYETSRVFALTADSVPGKVEGFGLVLLEAAAKGLPAVVTNTQALPEVVRDGETGWIVDERSSISAAINHALQCRDRSIGERCTQYATAFTWETCANSTYRTLHEPL